MNRSEICFSPLSHLSTRKASLFSFTDIRRISAPSVSSTLPQINLRTVPEPSGSAALLIMTWRWRDSNSRAGFEPTYRISSADPSTAWVHLQIYVISLVPTRRPIQPVEIGKNNRIEQATLFNLNSAGTRMVPRVSAVWHSA